MFGMDLKMKLITSKEVMNLNDCGEQNIETLRVKESQLVYLILLEMSIQVTLLTITHIFSILQNDLNYEQNVKQNYIQQCRN